MIGTRRYTRTFQPKGIAQVVTVDKIGALRGLYICEIHPCAGQQTEIYLAVMRRYVYTPDGIFFQRGVGPL